MAEARRGRGRPKGSTNKAKTNGAGSDLKGSGKPTMKGHNGPPPDLTDDERRALMMDHARKVRLIDDEIADKREARKRLIGAAKEDGIAAKDITAFNTLLNKSDDDIEAEQRKVLEWTRWQGRGVQTNLFDFIKKSEAVDGHARAEGFQVGAEGGEAKCDYTGASHEAWMVGFHAGDAARRSALKKLRDEEENTVIPGFERGGESAASEGAPA